jgi:uncharacterized membrane-anchored protein
MLYTATPILCTDASPLCCVPPLEQDDSKSTKASKTIKNKDKTFFILSASQFYTYLSIVNKCINVVQADTTWVQAISFGRFFIFSGTAAVIGRFFSHSPRLDSAHGFIFLSVTASAVFMMVVNTVVMAVFMAAAFLFHW